MRAWATRSLNRRDHGTKSRSSSRRGERPYEEALDGKQIEAAKNLIERAIYSMASIFGPPISQYICRIMAGEGDNTHQEGAKITRSNPIIMEKSEWKVCGT